MAIKVPRAVLTWEHEDMNQHALPAIGLLGSSAVFALLHIGPKARYLPWTVSSFGAGVMFGAIFMWTGDLTGPVVAHFLINFLQHAVTVIQANHVLDSKSLAGKTKFLFTHLAECAPCSNLSTANLPCLSPGRGNNHCLGTCIGIPGKGTSRAEAFIIWMSEDTKDT